MTQTTFTMALRLAVTVYSLLTAAVAGAAANAAEQPRFNVGDRIQFSQNGACLGERFALPANGTISEVRVSTGSYIILMDAEPGRAPAPISKPIYTQNCFKAAGAPPAPAPAPVPAQAPTQVQSQAPAAAPSAAGGGAAKFKVGDHVEFSANGACLGERYAIPLKGTILQVNLNPANNYVVQVDPEPNKSPRTISRPIYTQECGFRLLGSPAPPPIQYSCPLDPPSAPISRSSPPSRAVFERVIYDKAVENESTHADVKRIGMSFDLFEMAAPYSNQAISGGLRKDSSIQYLKHDGAPANATIYPIKVRYSRCLQRPTWKRLDVIEENRIYFKNDFGDWACPTSTGATKFLSQIDLPN